MSLTVGSSVCIVSVSVISEWIYLFIMIRVTLKIKDQELYKLYIKRNTVNWHLTSPNNIDKIDKINNEE